MAENEKFPLALPAGTVLAGQYVIDKVLGQGGFGITYAATDHNTNQKVAVKEFFPDSLAYREQTEVISYPGERTENFDFGKEGFLQEAKTLAEFIGCDNIVRIYSYFEENGTAYFVMEYIEGVSFDNYLKEKGGKITVDEAKAVLIPIMDALAIVHSKGIVHRDVTPDNIYITKDGSVKLLDFGAARYSLGDKSRSLDVILKHGFAPKEQYTRRGKQGPFTDVYSLGATFYFALTGRRPPDSIDRLEDDEMIPPSTLGADITAYEEEAILQAMAVNPQSRYQSMTAFKNVFMNLSGGQAAAAPAVQQQFFTAPQQPVGQTAQQPVGQTAQQPVMQPAYAQPVMVPRKPNYKPLIFTLIGIGLVICVVITVIFIGGIMSSSFGGGYLSGNTVSNIQSGGLVYQVSDKDIYHLSKAGGEIYRNGERILPASDAPIENLVYDPASKRLFYTTYSAGDGGYIVCSCGETDKYGSPVSELKRYVANQMYLFLTKDYYLVYTTDDGGTLYRIRRDTATGEYEEKLNTEYISRITVTNEYLYAICTDDDGNSTVLKRMSFTDFKDKDAKEYRISKEDGLYMAQLKSCGGYIYFMDYNADFTVYDVCRLDGDLSEKSLKKWDVSPFLDYQGYTYVQVFNVLDDHITFCAANWTGSAYTRAICHAVIRENENRISNAELIDVVQEGYSSLYKSGDHYYVYYYSDADDWGVKVCEFDKKGALIENKYYSEMN